MENIKTLQELRDFLNEMADSDRPYGVDPYELHGIDLSSLPTFGGEEPPRTEEIFSWDEENVLIQGPAGKWMIEPRS